MRAVTLEIWNGRYCNRERHASVEAAVKKREEQKSLLQEAVRAVCAFGEPEKWLIRTAVMDVEEDAEVSGTSKDVPQGGSEEWGHNFLLV